MRAAGSTPSQMVRSTLYLLSGTRSARYTYTPGPSCSDAVRAMTSFAEYICNIVCTSSNRTACTKKTTHPRHPTQQSRLQDRLANLPRERELLRTRLIRVGLLLSADEIAECVLEDEGNRFCDVGRAEGHGGDDGPEVLVGRGRGRGGGCGVRV